MNKRIIIGSIAALIVAIIAVAVVNETSFPQSPGEARREWRERRRAKVGQAGDEAAEAKTKFEQFAQARTAPGVVLPGAYTAAFTSLSGLPVVGSPWSETTTVRTISTTSAIAIRLHPTRAAAGGSPLAASSVSRLPERASTSAAQTAVSSDR